MDSNILIFFICFEFICFEFIDIDQRCNRAGDLRNKVLEARIYQCTCAFASVGKKISQRRINPDRTDFVKNSKIFGALGPN